jgi:hypothetical protein
MAKEYSFNERITAYEATNAADGLGGFSQVHNPSFTLWANCVFAEPKGIDFAQYKETLQLKIVVRNNEISIKIAPDFLVEFRGKKYRIAGRKSDSKYIYLTCYEAIV